MRQKMKEDCPSFNAELYFHLVKLAKLSELVRKLPLECLSSHVVIANELYDLLLRFAAIPGEEKDIL